VVLVVLHLAAEQVLIKVEVVAVEVATVEVAAVAEVVEAAEAVAGVTAGVVAGMFAPQKVVLLLLKVIIPRPPLQLPTITHRMTPHQSVQSAWRVASSGCLRVGTYFTLHVFTSMLFIGRQMLM
jgi:hypothetical protein